MDVQSGESEEEEVMGEETGESEMVPEWGWRNTGWIFSPRIASRLNKESWFQRQGEV